MDSPRKRCRWISAFETWLASRFEELRAAGWGERRRASALFGQDELVVAGDPEPVFLLVVDQDDLPAGGQERACFDPGNGRALFAGAVRFSGQIHGHNSRKAAVKPLPL